MKRFLLFVGDTYYPCGGWRDFKGSFDTEDEARAHAAVLKADENGYGWDWAHIVDTETMTRVAL